MIKIKHPLFQSQVLKIDRVQNEKHFCEWRAPRFSEQRVTEPEGRVFYWWIWTRNATNLLLKMWKYESVNLTEPTVSQYLKQVDTFAVGNQVKLFIQQKLESTINGINIKVQPHAVRWSVHYKIITSSSIKHLNVWSEMYKSYTQQHQLNSWFFFFHTKATIYKNSFSYIWLCKMSIKKTVKEILGMKERDVE